MKSVKQILRADLKDESLASKGYVKLARSGKLCKGDSKKVLAIAKDERDHHKILTKIMKKPLLGKKVVTKKKK